MVGAGRFELPRLGFASHPRMLLLNVGRIRPGAVIHTDIFCTDHFYLTGNEKEVSRRYAQGRPSGHAALGSDARGSGLCTMQFLSNCGLLSLFKVAAPRWSRGLDCFGPGIQ
jgi:hypothetical protein